MNSISLSLIPVISRGNVQVNMRNCSQYDRSFGRSSLRSTLLLLYAESIDMMVVQEKEVCGTFLHHALQVSRSSRELERIAETKNLDTQVPILSMPRLGTELWQCGVGMFVSQYSRLNRVRLNRNFRSTQTTISSLNIYLRLNATALYSFL